MNDRRDGAKDGEAEETGALERLLRAAGQRPVAPAERTERVRRTVHDHWRSVVLGRRRRRWLAWFAVPAAAAVASILILSPDLSRWIGPPTSPAESIASLERKIGTVNWSGGPAPLIGEEFAEGMALQTGDDGGVAVRLRNGIGIRIDRDSSVGFAGNDSLRLDRGRLYLDTEGSIPGSEGMAISTPFGLVRDVGTRFQVAVAADRLRVSVRAGAALIEGGGGKHEAIAGTRIDVARDGEVTRDQSSPRDREWDWVMNLAPEFDLEGAPLGRYLEWISRETGRRIEFADGSIAGDATSIILHGSVAGLRPDETLEVVLPTCGLRHRAADGTLIIERDPAASAIETPGDSE